MTDLPDSTLELIASGRKIEAIKDLRARTGMGLREAKEAVEAIERGESVSIPQHARLFGADAPEAAPAPNELATRVLALVQSGQTIQAIKEVRDATGSDLREAKQLVDRIAQDVQPDVAPAPASSQQAARLVVLAALLVALLGVLLTFLIAV
ncbi:MAG: ribosomal protein L7/L12 [Bacteroidota bacterium]